jgi:hypothetical protein
LQKPVQVQARLFVAISRQMENYLPPEAMTRRWVYQHRSNYEYAGVKEIQTCT